MNTETKSRPITVKVRTLCQSCESVLADSKVNQTKDWFDDKQLEDPENFFIEKDGTYRQLTYRPWCRSC